MSYLLDTNTISAIARGHIVATSRFRTALATNSDIYLSPFVEFELERGLLRSGATALRVKVEKLLAELTYVPMVRADWLQVATLWAHSRDIGEPIQDADLIIAAHAINRGAALVTHNTKHFRHFVKLGLMLDDWQT